MQSNISDEGTLNIDESMQNHKDQSVSQKEKNEMVSIREDNIESIYKDIKNLNMLP